ncbi:MAG: methyltransferase domain-containing protein [Pseudomonadales bacterium]|nr:methyltransferase domain-containing protein [Pseudomonadales bacterium]
MSSIKSSTNPTPHPQFHALSLIVLLTLLGLSLTTPVLAQDNQEPAQLDREALTRALASQNRELTDRLRDPVRKPIDVLEFLQLQAGMSALDVYAAGGYFTVVLSHAVGPQGKVYAQNTSRGLRFEEDRSELTQGEALAMKIRDNNLQNVIRIDEPVTEMSIPAEAMDFILVSQILHDYHNSNPLRALEMLTALHRVLKPGGILGIIDHVGAEQLDNRRLHRMLKTDAVTIVEQAGFILEADSDLLANTADNYRRSIFDPMLNRTTDQFLLRFRKPD